MGHLELLVGNRSWVMKQLHFDDTTKEVPWLKDYYLEQPTPYTPIRIDWVKQSPKGLLLMNTEHAKAFVFKGKKLYTFFLEALQIFSESEDMYPAFYMCCDELGNIEIYQEEQEPCSFLKTKSGEYHIQDAAIAQKKKGSQENPFLKSSPPPSPESTRTKRTPKQ